MCHSNLLVTSTPFFHRFLVQICIDHESSTVLNHLGDWSLWLDDQRRRQYFGLLFGLVERFLSPVRFLISQSLPQYAFEPSQKSRVGKALRPSLGQKMGVNDFPPELLTSILLNLPYKSLLSLQAVCVQWKAIVVADPALSVRPFKKPSKVYVEPGLPAGGLKAYISYGLRYEEHTSPESEPVRLHPAIQEASFDIGDDFAEMPLILYDEARLRRI
ncbi:hypothetical protein C8F04DRAFT_1196439 [Mycena alexandri]|uniref:F-box domain-containing protein n=1 Tax=Mycena alexandri TaxID=1745969 RepID=A0AAD6WPS1_9AGAR|nr:hypothetical protein C8F04DRAFT_1196439 [Mycena alexandri]